MSHHRASTLAEVIGAVFLISSTVLADPLAENQARFGKITGTVLVLTQGAKEWIDAHEDLPIDSGDRIHTEEDSTAELVLSENAFWWQQPESDVVFQHTEENSGSLYLENGSLLGRVDSAHAKMRQQWEFNTPSAVISIRGTEFALQFTEKKETHLGVIQGEVEVQPAEGPSGLPPALRVGPLQEAVVPRAKPARVLPKFSEVMRPLADLKGELRRRHLARQGIYSPLTTTYRQELRSKFVKPVSKPHPRPPRPMRKRGPAKPKPTSRGY